MRLEFFGDDVECDQMEWNCTLIPSCTTPKISYSVFFFKLKNISYSIVGNVKIS